MIVYKELHSIEKDLGISARTLYGLSNNISKHYQEVKIPKTDGGVRVLSVPDEALKRVQRAIAQKLLAYEPVSVYAKAYKPGSNIRKNAVLHVGKENLLKLDVYRFFDSISYTAVKEKVFPSNKYSEQIRILLTMLCYYKDALPQGAPTSPIISNIIMREFDETVGSWCAKKSITYTRYCDDMTFSGCFCEDGLIPFIREQLRTLGLILNNRKTLFLKNGNRKTVTGVVVNEKANTAKEYRRHIRQEIYYCQKFGVAEHLRQLSCDQSPTSYLLGLLGRVNYVLQITPDNTEFSEYKKQLSELLKNTK